MTSFWEQQSLLHTDIAIVGGGIVGLSVAASLKEHFPNLDVAVFERSLLPFGASTRNAGFACFGSLTEILADIETMGTEAAATLVHQRWQGLQVTRKRLGDDRIGFDESGGYELVLEAHTEAMGQVEHVNTLVSDFLPEYIRPASGDQLGLNMHPGQLLVRMAQEGQVHTGKLMRSLMDYVASLGVRMHTGAEVKQAREEESHCALLLNDPVRGEVHFRAKQVVVCTNAFVRELLPDLNVQPGRGQVFITHPIDSLRFRGNLHIDAGYYYLRNVGNRLLFGGARNLDFSTEATTEFGANDHILDHLEQKLRELIDLPEPISIDQHWSGIMAFGADKQPIVQRVDERFSVAVKMGGMGVALAGFVGEQAARTLSLESC